VNLRLMRRWLTEDSTIGDLYIDDKWECFVLEDTIQDGPKIFGKTAIPEGEYEIKITWSPRFQKLLPQIMDVPGFEGIRIHPGNTSSDTDGCLLVGQTRGDNWIGRSRSAFALLFAKLQTAAQAGIPISITIMHGELL
jgi:hypothetical protein